MAKGTATLRIIDRDRGWKALEKRLAKLAAGQAVVSVGIFGDSGVARYAAFNEFGTSTAPARPFIRSTFDRRRGVYANLLAEGAGQIIDGTRTPDQVLTKLGLLAKADIQRAITSIASPPNAPSTVRSKGSSNPLIDTGAMRNAVAFQVGYRPR